MDRKQQAVVAITLLEHGMGLLTAVTREATSLDLGQEIAGINRQILAMQGRLLAISETIERAPRVKHGPKCICVGCVQDRAS